MPSQTGSRGSYIPHSKPWSAKGSDFRPITCVSNLYKLPTKCAAKVMQLLVEERGLISENKLGKEGWFKEQKSKHW